MVFTIIMSIIKNYITYAHRYTGTCPIKPEAVLILPVLFVQLQCCGGASPADWQQSAWVQEDITDPHKLPESCCKEVGNPKRRAPKNSVCGMPGEWKDGKHPGVWEKVI